MVKQERQKLSRLRAIFPGFDSQMTVRAEQNQVGKIVIREVAIQVVTDSPVPFAIRLVADHTAVISSDNFFQPAIVASFGVSTESAFSRSLPTRGAEPG
jgi:hypothetical protein